MKGGETMDLKKLEKNLKARGFDYYYAADAEDAVRHILEQVQNTSVGIGGSTTADQLGLYDRLTETNQVHWHWKEGPKPEVYQAAAEAEVYISGVKRPVVLRLRGVVHEKKKSLSQLYGDQKLGDFGLKARQYKTGTLRQGLSVSETASVAHNLRENVRFSIALSAVL